MGVVDKIAKEAKEKITKGGKVALKGAGEAFNKLDELGGEARDSFKEWFDKSPAMEPVRDLIRKRETAAPEPEPEPEAAEVIDAVIVPKSLGDAAHAVQVFGKRSCPWSGRAVRLLEDAEIKHEFVELDDPENANYESSLLSETKQNTVPYIFVRGDFIGGFNALDELSRLGQLEAKIASTTDATGRVKVEVAARPNTDEVPPAAVSDHPGDGES